MAQTHFSRHAYDRVVERLTMEPGEVAALLDWDLDVRIGEEAGTDRVHRLFYSHDDYQCFVAVQDERTGMLVTILPVDYYELLAWRVSPAQMEEARGKVSPDPAATVATRLPVDAAPPDFKPDATTSEGTGAASSPPVAGEPPAVSEPPVAPEVFRIEGLYVDADNRRKSVNLLSWPSVEYGRSVARLIQYDLFFQEMHHRLAAKKGAFARLVALAIRVGTNSAKPVSIWLE